ncbi:MAG: ABC transporter ATP-binding protein [Candidatus Omnitrophica bacterium]|nr:ABC transporter ATP-binding protein [Candidatus Omnitrophota bacterium]
MGPVPKGAWDLSLKDNVIKTRNLSKTFYQGKNKIEAVKEVNLDIEKRATIAIIGPSGAGKSTLLHMLGGLDTPTSGSVIFKERDLYKLSDREKARLRNKKIGFVFQFYHLLPEFTVLENVIMPALIGHAIRDTRYAIRKRAEMLLGRMDLSHRLNHKPRELSGGEAQRVAIARALINEPDILLCDEPTGNLDSNMGEQIYGIIYRISKEREMSLVIVTHQQHPDFGFDKTYYIKDGRLSEMEHAWV